MRVLFIWWDSFGNLDVARELTRRGYEVVKYIYSLKMDVYDDPREKERLLQVLTENKYDFVFSFDYFSLVSIVCNIKKVKYVAWVYDSPILSIYHYSVVSPYNYIFLFDKSDYIDFVRKGIETVYYLPLAAPVERYDSYTMSEEEQKVYEVPISFVGSTYSENRHQFYKKLCQLDDNTKGYIDGILQAQKRLYGSFILQDALATDIVDKLVSQMQLTMNKDLFMGFPEYCARTFLAKYITVMERQEVLTMLSEKHHVALYTLKRTPSLPMIDNRGMAGSKKEASLIYRSSKINLNITLRTIRSGIPLRALEVMGSGGFLLTNLQTDFLDFFVPGEEFVYYDSYEDLMTKVEYYLSHDKERKEIAQNGYENVKKYHNYQVRFDEILDIINSR